MGVFLKLIAQLKCYSTTVLFDRVREVDKNAPKALKQTNKKPLSSVTIELPGFNTSDLTASRNTQHAINQRAP